MYKFMNKNTHLPSLSQQLRHSWQLLSSWYQRYLELQLFKLLVTSMHISLLHSSHLHRELQFHSTGFSGFSLSTAWETEEKPTATKIIFRNYWWKPQSLMVNYLPSFALRKPKQSGDYLGCKRNTLINYPEEQETNLCQLSITNNTWQQKRKILQNHFWDFPECIIKIKHILPKCKTQ